MPPPMQTLFQLTPFKIPFVVRATQTPAEVPCPPEREPVYSSTVPLCNIHRSMKLHILTPKSHVFQQPFLLAVLMANSCQSPTFRILKAKSHEVSPPGGGREEKPHTDSHALTYICIPDVCQRKSQEVFILFRLLEMAVTEHSGHDEDSITHCSQLKFCENRESCIPILL